MVFKFLGQKQKHFMLIVIVFLKVMLFNNSNSIVLISNYDDKMERDYHYSSKTHYADLENQN